MLSRPRRLGVLPWLLVIYLLAAAAMAVIWILLIVGLAAGLILAVVGLVRSRIRRKGGKT